MIGVTSSDAESPVTVAVACSLCAMEGATQCDVCKLSLCFFCHWQHPCLAFTDDFCDSPRGPLHDGTALPYTFCKVEAFKHAAAGSPSSCVRMGAEMYIYMEGFKQLSDVILNTGLGWHAFGRSIFDFQVYCEALSWDIPEGIVAINSNRKRALVFQPGRFPTALKIKSALSYLRALNAIGIFMHWPGNEPYVFSLVEVHRFAGQSLRLNTLRKQLYLAAAIFGRGVVSL